MKIQDTSLVLWQQICKLALQVFALMALLYMYMIPTVHGSAFTPSFGVRGSSFMAAERVSVANAGARNTPELLLARSNAGARNTPEPSPARSGQKSDPRQYNRESLRQARVRRKEKKSADGTAKNEEQTKFSPRTTSQNCPFGGAKEKQSIFSFPNQQYNRIKDRGMQK